MKETEQGILFVKDAKPEAQMPDNLPEGFALHAEFVSIAEEATLIEFARALPFGEVRMHGVTAKRRVAQFGWRYSFESYRVTAGPPVPVPLLEVRERVANLAQLATHDFAEVLVTEYPPGAGIGWHKDAPQFGIIAGVSLGSACRIRLRTGEAHNRRTVAVELPPRSIYVLTGSARNHWQHTIPPVRYFRWSVTFRTLRRRPADPA